MGDMTDDPFREGARVVWKDRPEEVMVVAGTRGQSRYCRLEGADPALPGVWFPVGKLQAAPS